MSELNFEVQLRTIGEDLKSVTRTIKKLLRSYLRSIPKTSADWVRADFRNGQILLKNLSQEQWDKLLQKACMADSRIKVSFEITSVTPEVEEFEQKDLPIDIKTEIKPDLSTPQIDSFPTSTRYKLLLTPQALQFLSTVPKAKRKTLSTFLQNLTSEEWEKWTSDMIPDFGSWRGEQSDKCLFTYFFKDLGLVVWERVWSIDLLGRITYPSGAYYENPPPTSSFAPHVIIYPIMNLQNPPSFQFQFHGESFRAEEGLNQPFEFDQLSPSDEVTYSEELYLLSQNRIDDLLSGSQRGLPLHLSEEQVNALVSEGPILLSGEAGSGKTSVITHWLVINHLRYEATSKETDKHISQLFVTLSPRLRDRARFEFETMLPLTYRNHSTRFLTYRELLEEIASLAGTLKNFPKGAEMTFGRFMRKYIGRRLQEYDPVLLWDEIRSVIKGGVTHESQRFVNLENYRRLSEERRQCKTPSEMRDIYYEGALAYQSYLQKNGLWDAIDLTTACISDIKLANKYDRIACDEVQDLAPVEISVLLRLLTSEDISFSFFTGDVAQVINPSGFMWSRLKGELGDMFPGKQIPEVNYLKRNYRNCYEIVDLVNAVLYVRKYILDDEVSRLNQLPLVQSRIRPMVLRASPLGLLSSLECNPERRLVLVKNSQQKEKLQEELGMASGRMSVLTIEEAKGLEWDGVLLWNFFIPRHESITKNDWEAVFVPQKQELLRNEIANNRKNPYALTYEFNLLHVGLTRARNLLMVYDDDAQIQLPNLGRPVVDRVTPVDLETFKFQWETDVPTPEDLRSAARRIMERDPEQANRFFRLAAQEFEKSSDNRSAGECYEDAEAYREAASCFKVLDDRPNELRLHALLEESEGRIENAGKLRMEMGKVLSENDEWEDATEAYDAARRNFESISKYVEAGKAAEKRAEAFPLDRVEDRARAFHDASILASKIDNFERSLHLMQAAVSEANRAIQIGKHYIEGNNTIEWIALRYCQIAYLEKNLGNNAKSASEFRKAAGLLRTVAGQSDMGVRINTLTDQANRALSMSVENYILSGEISQAITTQRELLLALGRSPDTEKTKSYFRTFADLYLEQKEYDQYVDTLISLANFLSERRENAEAIKFLKEGCQTCQDKKLNRLYLLLVDSLIQIGKNANNNEEIAEGYSLRAQIYEDEADYAKAVQDWQDTGKHYVIAMAYTEADNAFERGRKAIDKVGVPSAIGWYCFKNVVIDNYLPQSKVNLEVMLGWIEKSSIRFVQEIDNSIKRLNKYIESQKENVDRISKQRDSVSISTRKEELEEKRKAEVLSLAWTETCIAFTHSNFARISGENRFDLAKGAMARAKSLFIDANHKDDFMFISDKASGWYP